MPLGDNPVIPSQGGQLAAGLPGVDAWRAKKRPLQDNTEHLGVILLNYQLGLRIPSAR